MCRISIWLTGFLLLFFFSCRKASKPDPYVAGITTDLAPGLPASIEDLNGYFYFGTITYGNTITHGYAAFNEPARNLVKNFDRYWWDYTRAVGNVSVGDLYVNEQLILPSGSGTNIYYNASLSDVVPFSVKWKTSGNGAFRPLNQLISRGFPKSNVETLNNMVVKKSAGLVINARTYFFNYDSLVIFLRDGPSLQITKRFTAKDTLIFFSPAELKDCTQPQLSFYTYNYSYRFLDGKKLLFELSSAKFSNINLVP
jgi:hypothetical protein